MTPQEFIQNAPLYTQIELENFAPPTSIMRMCGRKVCKRETTWQRNDTCSVTLQDVSPQISFKIVGYTCALCRNNSLAVIYELLNWSEDTKSRWHHTAVRKVGQMPPQEISIPAELSDRLGTTDGHYKKALVSREAGYGIGAMAYLRRVVDEKTDELIDVVVELARTYNVDEKEIGEILAAKTQTRYEDKLNVAAQLIPAAIRPGGVNPLGQLYRLTSEGLHAKTDDECIVIFDDLKADFEYVFRNLHSQAEERRQFAKRVTNRAGKNADPPNGA